MDGITATMLTKDGQKNPKNLMKTMVRLCERNATAMRPQCQ